MDAYWTKVEEAIAAADEMPPEAFGAWLTQFCSGNKRLLGDIESLLAVESSATDFLEGRVASHAAAVLANEDEVTPGRRFGPYEIIREIGHGGMGAVYLCRRWDGEFDQEVALKIVRQSIAEGHIIERFRVERQILASLNHPNIAKLLDGGVSDADEPYLVMEYIEGDPITELVSGPGWTLSQKLRLFLKVCSAVSYAHRNFIVHRDIKPGNIIVTPDGEPKLLDFGLAKLLGENLGGNAADTQSALRALTPAYASPEQLMGEPITTSSDVYGLGVVLYEMLCGKRPFHFDGKSFGEIIRTVADHEPPQPSLGPAADPKLKGDLDNILLTSLRRDPERRYASVEQFAADIGRYLDGRPVSARPDTIGYRVSKFVKRHRIGVAATTLVLLSLIAGLAGTAWKSRQASIEKERAERINQFLEQMLQYSNPRLSPIRHAGEETTVTEVLDEAAKRLDSGEFDGDPELKLELERTVASTYLDQVKIQPARKHMAAYMDLLRSQYGENDTRYIVSAVEWGILLFAAGDVQGADGYYSQYLPRLRDEFANGRVGADKMAEALDNFAYLRRTQGDSRQAETLFRETLDLMPQMSDEERKSVATTRSTLASTIADQGRFAEALATAQQAVDEYRQRGETDSPNYGFSLVILGGFLTQNGDLAEAESCLNDAQSTFAGRMDPSSLWIGDGERNQAILFYQQGRYAEAIAKADDAAAIYDERFGKQYDQYPTVLIAKGLSLAKTGKLADGERLLREALELRTTTLPRDHFWVALAMGALGECLMLEKKYPEAEPLLLESFNNLKAAQGENDPRTEMARQRLAALYRLEHRLAELDRLLSSTA